MRLSESQIKQAILHADPDVRNFAIYYFSRSFTCDSDVTALAMQAVQEYGRRHAFFAYAFLQTLLHSHESIQWLIQQIEMHEESDDEDEERFFNNLLDALCNAEPSLLVAHKAAIDAMENLDDYTREAIEEQIHLPTLGPDALWQELESICQEWEDEAEFGEEDYDFATRLVSVIARYGDKFSERILAILRDEADDGLLMELAVKLAGEIRLEKAIPFLVQWLDVDDDGLREESTWALIRIGTCGVVKKLVECYRQNPELRLGVASVLENIHSNVSIEACLSFLTTEEEVFQRGHLIQAILHNCSSEGIEPARQHILSTPLDPDVLEVRSDLLIACKLLGMSFPELEAWTEESKNDTEFRKKWYKDHHAVDDLEEEFDDELDDEDTIIEVEHGYQLPPVVRSHERTGRNEPCPCGSGKKFKNCCYGKTGMLEEPDAADASDVFDQGRRVFHEQYPMGTVAHYGPDDKVTTKIVAAVIRSEGAEPILERWVGTNVMSNPKVRRKIQEFFEHHFVKAVVATDGNIGCPHEEGPDFPVGQNCPFCPFWAGKQGSAASE